MFAFHCTSKPPCPRFLKLEQKRHIIKLYLIIRIQIISRILVHTNAREGDVRDHSQSENPRQNTRELDYLVTFSLSTQK